MALPSLAPLSNSITIIGPQYCVPYAIELGIVKKIVTITDGNFVVTDSDDNILFKVKEVVFSLIHEWRVLYDATGIPIVTLQQKVLTIHNKWQVFRGDSNEASNLLFSVKMSSILQLKTKLHVFLAHNTREDVCDFKVKGSWFDRSCKIYLGKSSTVIAEMHKKHTAGSLLLGKDNYMVTVHPNIDYAFIVAIIAILDEINHEDDQK